MENYKMDTSSETRELHDLGKDELGCPASSFRGEADLSRIGKKTVLRRDFGFVSMLGLSCTVMVSWEGILLLFSIGFTNGGFAGTFWGFIIVWLGTLAAFTTMAELSSMAPTAGGQYHWTAMLAPRSFNRFVSYCVGWQSALAWQAIVAAGFFLCATLLQALVTMANAAYVAQEWQVPLLYWAFMVLAIFFNVVISKALPKVETVILVVHLLGFIVILIPLVVYGPSGISASTVFESFSNGGMWPTNGLSFMVGLVGPAFCMLGADSAVHMGEEIKNPAIHVPRAMAFSVFLNGLLAVAMLLAVLFSLGDANTVLAGPTGYPFMNIFLTAIPNLGGAVTMASIVFFLNICASISFVAAASRLLWAFSRDRGVPGWRYVSKVDSKSNLPFMAITVTVVLAFILSMIAFGSALAFNDVVSLATAGLYTSYLTGNSLLLFRRLKGDIKPYGFFNPDEIINNGPEKLAWGPWKLAEPLGILVNVVGCSYLIIMIVFIYFPTSVLPSPANMNWSIFMSGIVGIFAVLYYLLWGKRSYEGPIIDISD